MNRIVMIFFLNLIFVFQVSAQSNKPVIYNAEELIENTNKNGLKYLEEKIYPLDLLYLDTSLKTKIIEWEFRDGLISNHYDKKEIFVCETPTYTLMIADYFNDDLAQKKLFEYYCQIPKFIKSDTIYGGIDELLRTMVKSDNPKLAERLEQDYYEWTELSSKSPPKYYPTIEEYKNISFEESLKFKESDLITDIQLIRLYLAEALKYLQVKGFDDSLINALKKQQTYHWADQYSFRVSDFNPYVTLGDKKAIQNEEAIKDFEKDFDKLKKVIFENIDKCCDTKIDEMIHYKSKAYISVVRNYGYSFYLIELNRDNTITIILESEIIE